MNNPNHPEDIVENLNNILEASVKVFSTISEQEWHEKPSPEKWSKKEILGHLIDSAQNNLRRFVVTQYEQNNRIVYDQDAWVQTQYYQETDTAEIIQLWLLLNWQISRTLKHLPKAKLLYTCNTGKKAEEPRTIEYLMTDYVEHLKHHLAQINKALGKH